MTATTFETFPELKPRAKAIVAEAQTNYSIQEQKVKNLKKLQWFFGVFFICALFIGLAVGVNFNEALLNNVREELTTADWVVRFASAFGMEAAVIAGVWGIHTAFNRDGHVAVRVVWFILGLLALVAVFFVAAGIGYSKFGGLLDTLWNGFNGAVPPVGLEAGTPIAPATDIPFVFRLASSAPFIGSGLLAAFMEYGWLQTTKLLADTREKLAKYGVALDIHRKYEKARDDFFQMTEEKSKLEDAQYRHARAHTVVLGGVDDYRKQIEAARPAPIQPALVDRATYERHVADTEKTEACLRSADEVMSKMDKILALIARLFPVNGSQAIDIKGLKDESSAQASDDTAPDSTTGKKE